MPPINLISILITHRGYHDRFQLFFALDPHVRQHIIITRDPLEPPPTLRHTRLIHANDGQAQGGRFWRWASQQAYRLVRQEDAQTHWLVHSYFLGYVGLALRVSFPQRVSTILSLYSTNFAFLLSQGWQSDPHAGHLTWPQRWYHGRRRLWFFLLDIPSLWGAQTVIGNSSAVIDNVYPLARTKRLLVMPSAVDTTRFHVSPQDPAPPTFLYVGTLSPNKGLGTLIKAFATVAQEDTEATLRLIGRQFPPDVPWLARLIAQSGVPERIVQHPALPHASLAQHYRQATAFVFPSFFEGSPRVVKEALACGCPVIASDIAGNRIIDPDGRAIQFVALGDAHTLAQKMTQLAQLAAHRAHLSAVGRQLAQQFAPEQIASKLTGIYQTILEERHGASKS